MLCDTRINFPGFFSTLLAQDGGALSLALSSTACVPFQQLLLHLTHHACIDWMEIDLIHSTLTAVCSLLVAVHCLLRVIQSLEYHTLRSHLHTLPRHSLTSFPQVYLLPVYSCTRSTRPVPIPCNHLGRSWKRDEVIWNSYSVHVTSCTLLCEYRLLSSGWTVVSHVASRPSLVIIVTVRRFCFFPSPQQHSVTFFAPHLRTPTAKSCIVSGSITGRRPRRGN